MSDPEILVKHVNLSKKLCEEVQNLQNEVNWENIFNEENSYEVISSVANQLVYDVNKLIYNLHQIMIKITNLSGQDDLKILVNKLSKTLFDLQEVFGEECSVLKSKMIVQIRIIVKELQILFSIVENGELQEYKTELVDSLSEILSSLQKVLVYNHLKQLTSNDLEEVFQECERECRNLVAENHFRNKTNTDKTILEGLARHTLHGVISVQAVAFHFHKVANNYNDPIKEAINQIAKNLNKICMDLTVSMYEIKNGGDCTSPLHECMDGGFQAFRDMRKLINCDKSSENLNNLIFYGLSTTLCMAKRFTRDTLAENPKVLLKHTNFSKKLRKEVQILQDEVNWANILNKEDSYDVISSVANQFVHDVNKLIYNLHQIMIKINKNQSSYTDLKIFVKMLSKTSFDLQEVFGQEISIIKSKLIIQIQNIAKETQSLLRIVENVELHEFKTELVDFLSEIVSDLQKLLIYDHLKQLSQDELEKVFNAGEQECRDIVAANHLQHKTCTDKTILDGIARHTLNGVVSAQRVAFHLHKVAYNYNDPIKSKINQAAKDLNIVCVNITIGMYEMNRGDDGTSPLEKCMVDGFKAFRAIMNLSNLVDHCDKNEKDTENLKNLIFYGLSNTLCLARRFVRDMSAEVLQKM